jgi:hypothetical protein
MEFMCLLHTSLEIIQSMETMCVPHTHTHTRGHCRNWPSLEHYLSHAPNRTLILLKHDLTLETLQHADHPVLVFCFLSFKLSFWAITSNWIWSLQAVMKGLYCYFSNQWAICNSLLELVGWACYCESLENSCYYESWNHLYQCSLCASYLEQGACNYVEMLLSLELI